jgi:hypothetical protein
MFLIQGCISKENINLIIQAAIAIGTIAVAIIAIYGDYFRNKIFPPKAKIILHNTDGILTSYQNGIPVWFYHLKVVNQTHFSLKNCRVFLKEIQKKGPDDSYDKIPLPVPHQFIWSPAGFEPKEILINKDHIFDFGSLSKGSGCWKPELYWRANNFIGDVKPGEVVRYILEVDSEGMTAEIKQIYEVAWNGKWSDKLEEMKLNLKINEVTNNG